MKNRLYKDLSVLVVEDEMSARVEMVEVLSLSFKSVYSAEDGCMGMKMINQYHPNLVISDISMPCMNGVEMLIEAKKISENSIFIFTTAHSDTKYLLSAIDNKVDSYLIKPIKFDILYEKIEKSLQDRVIMNQQDSKFLVSISHSKLLHQKLSKREYEVFLDIAKGIKPNNIAQKYNIKSKTISTYRTRILEKMCINSNTEIIKYAIKNNLI